MFLSSLKYYLPFYLSPPFMLLNTVLKEYFHYMYPGDVSVFYRKLWVQHFWLYRLCAVQGPLANVAT